MLRPRLPVVLSVGFFCRPCRLQPSFSSKRRDENGRLPRTRAQPACGAKDKKRNPTHRRKSVRPRHDIQGSVVGTTELESVTSCMSSKRSNQLSYAPAEQNLSYTTFLSLSSDLRKIFRKKCRFSLFLRVFFGGRPIFSDDFPSAAGYAVPYTGMPPCMPYAAVGCDSFRSAARSANRRAALRKRRTAACWGRNKLGSQQMCGLRAIISFRRVCGRVRAGPSARHGASRIRPIGRGA